jgi:oxygen-independent coproporphyrinogen III oxidase
VGISGIGDVQGAYVQNVKKLPAYYQALDAGHLPVERGVQLDANDLVRRHVIMNLMCNLFLDVREVEKRFGIRFDETFASELRELSGEHSPASDGLVRITPEAIEVTPQGRLFVRNVCMVFDRYLRARTSADKPIFSRTV